MKVTGKSKVISSSSPSFIKAGGKVSIGNTKVGTQTPGQTSTKPTNTGGKFAAGGKGGSVGKPSVKTAVAGKVMVANAKAGGSTGKGGGRRGDGSTGGSGFGG